MIFYQVFQSSRLFKTRFYLHLNELMESPCLHLLFSSVFVWLTTFEENVQLVGELKATLTSPEKLKLLVARIVFLPEEQPLSFIAPVREPWTCPQVAQKLTTQSLRTLVILGDVKSKSNVREVILTRHILNNF